MYHQALSYIGVKSKPTDPTRKTSGAKTHENISNQLKTLFFTISIEFKLAMKKKSMLYALLFATFSVLFFLDSFYRRFLAELPESIISEDTELLFSTICAFLAVIFYLRQ